VYDEKVQGAEIFQNQRRRWMSAQITFMKKYAVKGIIESIRTFNVDYFDKCIQLILLPRLISLGVIGLLSLLWFTNSIIGDAFLYILGLQIIALFLSIPSKFFNLKTFNALLSLPYGFVLMFLNLFKLRGADKKFIHTPHSANNKEK
jgi:hypothetical protein